MKNGDSSCAALAKACERTIQYLREIGEFTREESTFPSPDYADTMADDLEYALARYAKEGEIFVPMAAMTENEQAAYCRERCTDALGWSDEKRCECRKTSMCNGLMTRVEARKEQEAGR